MTVPLRAGPTGPLAETDDITSDEVENLSSVAGATVTEALDALITADRLLRYEIYEDFDYVCATNFPAVPPTVGTTEDLMHFRSNWAAVSNVGSGFFLLLPGIAGHPGVIRLETQSATNRILRMYGAGPGWVTGAVGSQGSPVNYDDIEQLTWVARVPAITTGGFLLSVTNSILRTSTVEFALDTSVSAQLQCNTVHGGVSEQTLLAMPSDGDFHQYRIDLSATEAVFYLDEVEVARHTTGLPVNQALNPYMFALTRAVVVRQLDLDLFWLKGKELAR
jgi:hypothetical protein